MKNHNRIESHKRAAMTKHIDPSNFLVTKLPFMLSKKEANCDAIRGPY